MSAKSVGTHWEHQAKELLESQGYIVMRSSASRSPFDLIALNAAGARFIQVKQRRAYTGISEAKSHFKADVQDIPQPEGIPQEIWIHYKGEWHIWYRDGEGLMPLLGREGIGEGNRGDCVLPVARRTEGTAWPSLP